jgi:hypothetical protein
VAAQCPNGTQQAWEHKSLLGALSRPGNEHKSLLDLLAYIGQQEDYKATWEVAARANGLVLLALDGVATNAVQLMCNMNKLQMKELRSCLKAELGLTVFSKEYKIQEVLGLEHVKPRTGYYKYGKEKIGWLYKPIKEMLKLWLKSCTEGPSNFLCNHLDIFVTIGHGKGHLQITWFVSSPVGKTRMENGTRLNIPAQSGMHAVKRTTQTLSSIPLVPY